MFSSFFKETSVFSSLEHALNEELPYDAYDEEHELYYNKSTISFCIESAPLTGANDEVIKLFNNVLQTAFPDDSVLQVHLFASTKIGNILEQWNKSRINANPIFKSLSAARMQHFSTAAYDPLLPAAPVLLRDFRVFFSVSFDCRENNKSIREICLAKEQLLGCLRALNIAARNVGPREFINTMREWINPNKEVQPDTVDWDQLEPLRRQLTADTKEIRVLPDRLKFGEEIETRVLVVDQYPKQWPLWAMQGLIGDAFHASQRISCPFYIDFKLYFPSQQQQRDRAAVKSERWQSLRRNSFRRFVKVTDDVVSDLEKAISKSSDGEKYVWAMHTLVLYCKKGTGETAEFDAKNLYLLNGWKLRKALYLSLPLWLASLPMSLNKTLVNTLRNLGFFKTMLHSSAANLLPVIAENKGFPEPKLLLIAKKGQLFGWDPFAEGIGGGNYIISVIGNSGSGKSVYMQETQLSILAANGQVWAIDLGRSSQNICQLVGGQMLDFSPEAKICLNPFSKLQGFDGDDLAMIKTLIMNMAFRKRECTDIEDSFIEEAITVVWKEHGTEANISRIAEWLEFKSHHSVAKDIGRMLYAYTEKGVYGSIWNGKNNVDFDNPYVLLELDQIEKNKDLQVVVLLAFLLRVASAMFLGDRKQVKLLNLDEVLPVLKFLEAAAKIDAFIDAFARRLRKHKGAMMLGGQDTTDFTATKVGQIVYKISDWKILLQQGEGSIQEIIKNEGKEIDPYQQKLMRSLCTVNKQYSEVYLMRKNWHALGRLVLDPFSSALYSSRAEDFETIRGLQARGYSLVEAVQTVARQNHHG